MQKIKIPIVAVMLLLLSYSACRNKKATDVEQSIETAISKPVDVDSVCEPMMVVDSRAKSSLIDEPKFEVEEIQIGDQIWMANNLDTETFANGDTIHNFTSNEGSYYSSWCYYKFNSSYGKKYGKLYNWHAVADPRGLAPKGYHIPSEEEWNTLIDYLGGKEEAGAKMKSTLGWKASGNGSNSSGFNGLPGGYLNSNYLDTCFYDRGYLGYWWCSSSSNEYQGDAVALYSHSDGVAQFHLPKQVYMSVRCIKD